MSTAARGGWCEEATPVSRLSPAAWSHGISSSAVASRWKRPGVLAEVERQQRADRREKRNGQRPGRGLLPGDAAEGTAQPEKNPGENPNAVFFTQLSPLGLHPAIQPVAGGRS